MKRVVQTNVRKVYGQTNTNNQQDIQQMNTARKINSLLSSGAVSVTGPTQTRILNQKQQQTMGPKGLSPISSTQTGTVIQCKQECYVCGENAGANSSVLTEAITTATCTKLPNKIGRMVGDSFMVVVCVDDVVCKRCVSMFNHMDRLENDLERVKSSIMNLINKKYGITEAEIKNSSGNTSGGPPAAKMQRLTTTATTTMISNRKQVSSNGGEDIGSGNEEVTVRKIAMPTLQAIQQQNRTISNNVVNSDPIESQLTTIFDTPSQQETAAPVQVTKVLQQSQQVRSSNVNSTSTTITPIVAAAAAGNTTTTVRKTPIKIYKCMSCEFKTTDLKFFQPHYETCKQQNGNRCKVCKKVFNTPQALKAHTQEKHSSDNTCSICSINYLTETAFKKHMETNHPDVKTIETTTVPVVTGTLFTCNMCMYRTSDKQNYDEHLRKHIKVKPFKCRICSMRFESRDQAAIHAKSHQPEYFKCGKCAASFPYREQLIKHFETHKQQQQQQVVVQTSQPQQQQIIATTSTGGVQQILTTTTVATTHQQQQQHQPQQQQIITQDLTTQKLLQDTIDEALRDTGGDADSKIHFFSCNICSLTFIQENYYNQHMETHKRDNNTKKIIATTTGGVGGTSITITTPTSNTSTSQSLIRQDVRNTNATLLHTTQANTISDADIESMFEKMHSDKVDTDPSGNSNSSENLVITKQENSVGGITFNITLPPQDGSTGAAAVASPQNTQGNVKQEIQSSSGGVSIDMPVLDHDDEHDQDQTTQQHDDEQHQQQQQQIQYHVQSSGNGGGGAGSSSGPVSMPSLDDDGDSSQPSNTDQIPMDLEDIQNAGDGQIKFILNEDGQILQLDNNHIITTDDDGNQILVQGTDSEQIQQLLQSVGVLQAGDGDGETTYQMIQGENNQMIIVQGDNNEAQLIDASMLNEDGHLVIQHQEGDELPEGMHIVNEDGVQVPVSIAFQQHHHHQQQQQQQQEQEHLQQEQEHQQQEEHDDGQQYDEHADDGGEGQQIGEGEDIDGGNGDSGGVAKEIDDDEHDDGGADDGKSATALGGDGGNVGDGDGTPNVTVTTTEASSTTPVTSTTGEVFFNLEDLMQQSEQKEWRRMSNEMMLMD